MEDLPHKGLDDFCPPAAFGMVGSARAWTRTIFDTVADLLVRFLPLRGLIALVAYELRRAQDKTCSAGLTRVDRLLEASFLRATANAGNGGPPAHFIQGASLAECLVVNARSGTGLYRKGIETDFALVDEVLNPEARTPSSWSAGERTLVICLQGTDIRRALAVLGNGKAACLTLASQREPPLPVQIERLDRGYFRAFDGYHENEAVRSAIDDALTRLTQMLPPEFAGLVSRHEIALSNELMTECDRFILQTVDMLEHVRRYNPDRILILEGDQRGDHLVAALEATGFPLASVGVMCGAYRLSPILSFSDRRKKGALPDCMSRAEAIDAFAHSVDIARKRLGRIRCKDRVIVMAATNPRHFGAATEAIQALGQHWAVEFLIPDITLNLRVIVTAISQFWQSLWRVKGRIIRSRAWLVPEKDIQRWRKPISDILLDSLESAGLPSSLKASVCFGAEYFCARHLAAALASAAWFEAAFRNSPPRHVVLIPGTLEMGMLAAGAARATGVPSLQIQTLLTQPNAREYRPVADRVGVIDTSQAELYHRYFGLDPAKLLLTGYLDSVSRPTPQGGPADRGAASRHRDDRSSRYRIAFISQPLPEITGAALAMLIEAIRHRDDIDLTVYAHPREDSSQLMATNTLVTKAGLGNRLIHRVGGTPWNDVLAADLVACLYSNLGIQAASAGKNLMVIDPTTEGYPCRFDDMGIALKATSPVEIGEVIENLRSGNATADKLEARRQNYFARNPQLTDASGLALLVETIRGSST